MNKKIVIAIVAGVVLVAGGAAAYVLTRPDETTDSLANTSDTTEEHHHENDGHDHDHSQASAASISEFMKAGEIKKCTYNDDESAGTMYFARNERLRMDYRSKADPANSGSAIITSGQQYVWSNSTKQGVKFAFTPSGAESQNQSSSQQNVDVNKKYNFTCENWLLDESVFTPPADVKFTDFSTLPALPQR